MTTLYKFTHKIAFSWAKKVLKPILETWNTNDVIVLCLVYLFSDKIKLKICNAKKNNSKCSNLQWKTKIIQIESKIKSAT